MPIRYRTRAKSLKRLFRKCSEKDAEGTRLANALQLLPAKKQRLQDHIWRLGAAQFGRNKRTKSDSNWDATSPKPSKRPPSVEPEMQHQGRSGMKHQTSLRGKNPIDRQGLTRRYLAEKRTTDSGNIAEASVAATLKLHDWEVGSPPLMN